MKHVVMIASLVALLATTGLAVSEDAPKLELDRDQVDFGDVVRGSLVRQDVAIKNGGGGTLEVSRVGANCDCASLRLSTGLRPNIKIDTKNQGAVDLTLKAGRAAKMAIIVDTSKLPEGEFKKRCLVFANDRSAPHVVNFRLNITLPKVVANVEVEPGHEGHDHGPGEGHGRKTPEVLGPPPRLEVDHYTVHVGELLRGEVAEGTYTITNRGEGPLILTSVRETCQCTASSITIGDKVIEGDQIKSLSRTGEVAVLETGQSASLVLTMDTGSLPTVRYDHTTRKAIRVYSNDRSRNPLMLNIEADVKPAFTLDPQYFRFPIVRKGGTAELKAILKSEQIGDYNLDRIEVPNATVLSTSFEEIGRAEDGSPKYEITVSLEPGAPIGRLHDQMVLHFQHDRVKELRIPVYGEIHPQVVFHGNQNDGSGRLNFGVLAGDKDTTIEMRIENLEPGVPYVPKTIELTSRHPEGSFAYELIEVTPGVEYRIKVTVKKELKDRFFSGRLRVTADHPDVPVKLIDFRGWVDPERAKAAAAAKAAEASSNGTENR